MASDELVIDLSNYKDRVGSRVTPGRYRVQVEDAEQTESAAKNPMINLWFRIVGGEFDGQTVTDRLVLTEKSLFRVVGFMQAVNLPTPKKRLKINLRQFVGRTLDIDIEDGEPYNGRVRSEVRQYIRVAKSSQSQDSGDDLAGLTAAGDGAGAVEPEAQSDLNPTSPTVGGGLPSQGGTATSPAAAANADSDSDPWRPADEDSDEVNLDDIRL